MLSFRSFLLPTSRRVLARNFAASTGAALNASLVDSDSVGGESGFEEQEVSEVQNNIVKFVTKFIDKVIHSKHKRPRYKQQL